jgi:signal transduction histidine kinase
VQRAIARTAAGGTAACVYELEVRAPDGTRVPLEVSARCVTREGDAPAVQCIARDLSDRRRLEAQLHQSQKMEAVGRLAGGVAHDFNNLLAVILGYSDIALERLPAGAPLRREVELIRKAADSAAGLTRQLLAFSRRQVLQPRVLDLNAVLRGLDPMLRPLLGEPVDLVTVLEPELGRVRADPGQLEQVIVNLVLNARDAMPRGGRLTLETANVLHRGADGAAERHVMLAVSDTGRGMDAETVTHVFEPFFTTKEKGKGTGLGLSTAYGIVKQHHGSIEVDSKVGVGTTFRTYLPRVDEAAEERATPPATPVVPGGSETILLVEDEEPLRELVRELLLGFGYTVLDAEHGGAALEVAGRHPSAIHLLLTDIVMPVLSGEALAQRLTALRPGVKVLFMSGYTDDVLGRHGIIDSQLNYLQKPFPPERLAQKVRDVLDAAEASAPAATQRYTRVLGSGRSA